MTHYFSILNDYLLKEMTFVDYNIFRSILKTVTLKSGTSVISSRLIAQSHNARHCVHSVHVEQLFAESMKGCMKS